MHHVLPAADYLVRMLDGRIDSQGPFQDMRAEGTLENIALDAAVEVKKELEEAVFVAGDPEGFDGAPKSPLEETKKPRKLVKDEDHEMGHQVVNI